MKLFIVAVILSCISSASLAQTKGYTTNKSTPYTGNTKTYPNFVAPKDPNTTPCRPVVVTEYNVFTKQPQQVVKCY